MRRVVIFFAVYFFHSVVFSQTRNRVFVKDTLTEVVITSTRTITKLGNVAVPVKIVSKKYIEQTGSLKLQDILQEQTGITVVNSNLATSLNGYPNPFGQGVQMLGLDPAYTAVLIDGEPLVGRNAGILKLGRIATGNIKQIEIVKGPSSSLYGSEALAGVINIITELPDSEITNLQAHAASNNTYSQSISFSKKKNNTGLQLFLNHYSTSGYDLQPEIYGKTADPFRDWNANIKLTHSFNANTELLLSLRKYDSKQDCNYLINWQSAPSIVSGYTSEKDNTAFLQLKRKAGSDYNFYFRTFYDSYNNKSFANLTGTDLKFDETSFTQSIIKPEIQAERSRKHTKTILGGGAYIEKIDASRYAGKQQLYTGYAFIQNEAFLFDHKLTLITGIRADKRNDYELNASPRMAVAYKPNNKWKFTASAGYGFKAPDFRHMYLNFYNSQIGYSLIGNQALSSVLQTLQQQGELESGSDITPYLTTTPLLPEKSFGIHAGVKYTSPFFTTEISIFRNDIKNLIDVYMLPFKKTGYRSLYSYHNINSIFTEGAEIDTKVNVSKHLQLSAGYQFLDAKDKNMLQLIKAGKIYKRDPATYQTSLVTTSDYFGLSNRSRNSFNFKILWQNKNNNVFFRAIYRGKYGYNDINGNNIIDDEREMVTGFWNLKIAAEKQFSKKLGLQAGIDNILDYTNPLQQPDLSGRIFFININYSINKFSKKH